MGQGERGLKEQGIGLKKQPEQTQAAFRMHLSSAW